MEITTPRRARPAVLITERDRQILAFAAEHRFVIAAQPAALLGVSVAAAEVRLRALAGAGYLGRQRTLAGEPFAYQVSRRGLRAIGSDLPTPHAVNLAAYDHDLGLGWLMVVARRGWFGPLRAVISERRMRSDDGRVAGDGEAGVEPRPRHGVRLGGSGPAGRERLHYPDMVILAESGHRVAFELELSGKSRVRREGILAGYAADRHVDLVVYLVTERRVGRDIQGSAARIGIPQLVRVQPVLTGRSANRRPVPARSHARVKAQLKEAAR